MNKKNYLLIACLSIILIGLSAFIYNDKKKEVKPEIILFYSAECSHCKEVDNFLQENNIHAKINFVEKEIVQNRANIKDLIKVIQKCDIPKSNYIEVPLLWTGSGCLIGKDDIIKFFTDAIKK